VFCWQRAHTRRRGHRGAVHFGVGRKLAEGLTANGLVRSTSPFSERVPLKGVTWLEPKLTAQVSYAEIMQDGRLRAGVFWGFVGDRLTDGRDSTASVEAGR
jgi:hypothetical protein